MVVVVVVGGGGGSGAKREAMEDNDDEDGGEGFLFGAIANKEARPPKPLLSLVLALALLVLWMIRFSSSPDLE